METKKDYPPFLFFVYVHENKYLLKVLSSVICDVTKFISMKILLKNIQSS